MAEKKAALDGLVVPTDVKEVLETSGWIERKVHAAGNEADAQYVFKAKLGWKMTRELYAGPEATGEPLVTATAPRRGPLCLFAKRPVTLQLGPDETLLLEPVGRWSLTRRFAWQGRTFEWRLASAFISAKARLVLEHLVGGDKRELVAEFVTSSWTRRGTLTVRQGEHGLPRKLLLVTALTMEALHHARNRSRSGHGYSGG